MNATAHKTRCQQVNTALLAWVAAGKPNECLLFDGGKTSGYGRMYTGGKMVLVHRYALTLFAGPCPEGMEACHATANICGNRHCFSPAHLRWGTREENQADKIPDGTANRGTLHGRAKLVDFDVLEIRRTYAAGGTSQRKLAAEYGVSRPQIGKIILRRRWAY
nr:HNH endonuclease [bacterium]